MFLSDLPVCLSDIVRSSLFKQSLAIIHQMQYPKIRNFRHIYGFFNSPPPDILSLVWSLCMFHISLSDSPNSLFGYFLYKYFANFVSQIFFYKYAAKSVCELFLSKKSANCCVWVFLAPSADCPHCLPRAPSLLSPSSLHSPSSSFDLHPSPPSRLSSSSFFSWLWWLMVVFG